MIKQILPGIILMSAIIFTLAGCSRQSTTPTESATTQTDQNITDISLDGNHPLAVIQAQQIWVVDPDSPDPKPIYSLEDNLIPPTQHLFDLKISPSKRFIAWYSPDTGMISLDLESKQIVTVHPQSDWLNKNPYFNFLNNQDTIAFVDNQGTQLFFIDLTQNTTSSTTIPYPFGNVFRISPDNNHVIFVSGFGQTDKFPQYMITTINGENPKRFVTEATLNRRGLVEWLPDSSGVILVSKPNQILFVSKDSPNQQEVYYQLEDPEKEITDLGLVDNHVYVSENDLAWEIIDITTRKRVARSPVEIAEELYRPTFIPWYDKTFLMEETIRLDSEQFNRLWKSNFVGIKQMVIDKYQESTITSDTPSL